MYKPSPQALKNMMHVKPQGDDYEEANDNNKNKNSQKKKQTQIAVHTVSSDDGSSDDDDDINSMGGNDAGPTATAATRPVPEASNTSTISAVSAASSTGGPAGLFAERKDAKPMPMNPRRSVPFPQFTRRNKKPRSATMLRRTGSNASHFSTDGAMSVDAAQQQQQQKASLEHKNSNSERMTRTHSIDEDRPLPQVHVVLDTMPRAASPFSHLSDDLSVPAASSQREDAMRKEHEAKMEQLEQQMQQQMRQQQLQQAALEQKLMEQERMLQQRQQPQQQQVQPQQYIFRSQKIAPRNSNNNNNGAEQQAQQQARPMPSPGPGSHPQQQPQAPVAHYQQQQTTSRPPAVGHNPQQMQQHQVQQQPTNQSLAMGQQQPISQPSAMENNPQQQQQQQQQPQMQMQQLWQQQQQQQQPPQQTIRSPGVTQQGVWSQVAPNQGAQPQQAPQQQQQQPQQTQRQMQQPRQAQFLPVQQQQQQMPPTPPSQQQQQQYSQAPSQQLQHLAPPPSAQSSQSSTGYLSRRQQAATAVPYRGPQQQGAVPMHQNYSQRTQQPSFPGQVAAAQPTQAPGASYNQLQKTIAEVYDEQDEWNQIIGGPPSQAQQQGQYPIPAALPPPSPSPSQWSQPSQAYSTAASTVPQASPQGYPAPAIQQYTPAQAPNDPNTRASQSADPSEWLANLSTQLVVHQHQNDAYANQVPQQSIPVSQPPIVNNGGPPLGPTGTQEAASQGAPPSQIADPVYTKALEDLWSQVDSHQHQQSPSRPAELSGQPHQQQMTQIQNGNAQSGSMHPPRPTQESERPHIAPGSQGWQQGQPAQIYPGVPMHSQQTEQANMINEYSERSRASGSVYSTATQPHSNSHAQTSVYSTATQPHSNIHARANAMPQVAPVAYNAQEENEESGFFATPFGSGALPPGSSRNVGQNGAALGGMSSGPSQPATMQESMASQRRIQQQQQQQQQQPNSNGASRATAAATATATASATRPSNGASIPGNTNIVGSGRSADRNEAGRKGFKSCAYLCLALVVLLLVGGATVAVLYFLTDVFEGEGDVMIDIPSSPTLSPVLQPTLAPTSESTTESTGGGVLITLMPTPDSTNTINATDNTTSTNFTGGYWNTMIPTPGPTNPSNATANETSANSTILYSPASPNMSTNSSDGSTAGTVAANFTSQTNSSAATSSSASQTFEWQPLDQGFSFLAPGIMTGSFLATNNDGSVLLVGSSAQAATESVQLNIVYKLSADGVPRQLGAPLLPTMEDAAFVSAAMNAEGTIIALGANDGTVQIYDFNAIQNVWTQRGEDLLLSGERLDSASVSVALSATGRNLVVGLLDTELGILSVQPYLFMMSSSSWTPIGDEIRRVGRRLSASVDISPNGFVMAFTHVFTHTDGMNRGLVETYELNANEYDERGSFTLLNISDVSVSLDSSGATMVVTNDKQSTVYGYDSEVSTSWEVQTSGSFLAGGTVVSMDNGGTLLTIGNPDVVITYEYIDSWWRRHVVTRRKLELAGAADDGFGSSLALSGDGKRLAVGAPFNDDEGDDAGKVFLFQAS